MRAEFSLQSLYPRRSICLRVLWGYCSFGAGYAGNRALPSWCETPFLPSLRITVGADYLCLIPLSKSSFAPAKNSRSGYCFATTFVLNCRNYAFACC